MAGLRARFPGGAAATCRSLCHETPRSVAREISYASSARTRAGRAVIRSLENMTGRLRLIRMARGYDLEVAQGRDFWEVMVERYGLSLGGDRAAVSTTSRARVR